VACALFYFDYLTSVRNGSFFLGVSGKLRPRKLRPGQLRAINVTSRHLVRDGSGEKENSDPFLRNTCFQNKKYIYKKKAEKGN